MKTLFTTLILLFALNQAKAVIWHVGPAQSYTMPSQVAPLVNHGDTVNIDAGIYNSNPFEFKQQTLWRITLVHYRQNVNKKLSR